jgi:hypothetical protein
MFVIPNKLLLKLNLIPLEQKYELKVAQSSFKYNKAQLPFISGLVINHFLSSNVLFILENQSNTKDFIQCYSSFDSLFRSHTELEINKSNISAMRSIAKAIGNTFLVQVCNKVTQKIFKNFH